MEKRIKLERRARKANQITELNLDNCRSASIVGLTDEYTALESLSLINVGLTTLKGFPKLPNLKKLELSDNRISNGLNYLTTSPKLQYLNLSGNKIKDLETLKPLEEFQKLAVLDLFNNDATQVENYREKIFKMLPSLTFLDGFDCNDEEVQSDGEDDEEGNDSDEAMSPPKKSHGAKKPDNNVVLQAIKSCIIDENAIRKSAREHGINDRTLSRYVKKTKDNFEDISKFKDEDLLEFIHGVGTRTPSNMVFSPAQEKDLVRYILKYVSHYYGLSINELKELAYQFARKLSIRYPPEWDNDCKAHRKWYRLFMQRHSELTLRTPEQTEMNRVKAFCKPNVDNFFENLSRLIDVHNFDGCSIYNMNESGFSTVPTKIGKVIALKGQLEAAERGTMVTLALTVCANGNTVPPFFLFPKKKMERTFLDNVSPGIAGFANDSGWMGQPEFVRYIRHFIKFVKPSKDRPVLLLMDNHVSHMSVEALDFADANGVHILSFPPHCSHRLQPLDVSVLGPMKTYYESQCSAWQNNNANKVLEIRHIAGLVCNALDFVLTPKIIKAGFAATGIVPFNPDIFTDADFVQTIAQNEEQVAFDAGITKDDQRRIVLNNTLDIGHGKEVLTSEISTPQSLSLMSLVTSSSSVLDEIDPLQVAVLKKPSNRERRPMQSAENRFVLKEKTAAKGAKKRATPGNTKHATPSRAAKRFKPTSPPSDEETDFCIICLKLLPQKLTAANSINCNVCKRPVHFKCSNMQASYFTCKSCESDVDDDDGE
ncbi:uncharacterized protein Dwil_GK22069 [Drosophila willistoni]|uniref:DDE-1 domain-containing protein n=1 Tax=Drosophila willistoni TaxID=7260 RepID=B4MYJ5_DROWI|nr:uncharacterized protein LOC6643366 [Drosophila willistoni]EDW77184.1 uncharacterized protein Dwil_GK22069 [Drosophila willistoni]